MTTSLLPLPAGVAPAAPPSRLVGALNAVLGAVTGAGRKVRRVGSTPMPYVPQVFTEPTRPARSVSLPAVNPSALDPATTAWVRDALTLLVGVVLKTTPVSWQTAARFLGWLKAYAEVGCGMTPDLVLDEWNAKHIPLRICGGPYEKYLPAGLELLKQYAGYPADAPLEPIFLWLVVVEAYRAEPAEQPAA